MDELKHFGVKGMRWGVWNEETRARRQHIKDIKKYNKAVEHKKMAAGSREFARLQKSAKLKARDIRVAAQYEAKANKILNELGKEKIANIEKELGIIKKSNSPLKKAEKFNSEKAIKYSKDFNDYADQLEKAWPEYYKTLKNNPKYIANMHKELYKHFGGKQVTQDDFEDGVRDVGYEVENRMAPQNLKNLEQKFWDAGNAYFDEVRKNNLETDSYNSHMYRHYEDYWKYDVDERYDLESSLSVDNYNNYARQRNR